MWLPVCIYAVTYLYSCDFLSVFMWLPVCIHVITCLYLCGCLIVFTWLPVCIHVITCLYLCGYLFVFIWLSVCIHVVTCLYLCGYLSVFMWLPVCIYVITCLYLCDYLSIFMWVYVCIYVVHVNLLTIKAWFTFTIKSPQSIIYHTLSFSSAIPFLIVFFFVLHFPPSLSVILWIDSRIRRWYHGNLWFMPRAWLSHPTLCHALLDIFMEL